jgi:hypothetical protein
MKTQMYIFFAKKTQKYCQAFITILLFMLFWACSGSKEFAKLSQKQQISIKPNPLEVHGGEVRFKISASIPPEMIKKDATYEISVFYIPKDSSLKKKLFEIGIVHFQNAKSSKNSLSKEQDFSFLYDKQQALGSIVVKGTQKGGKKNLQTPYFAVGKGVIHTSTLLKDCITDTSVFRIPLKLPSNTQNSSVEDQTIWFYFEQGKSKLSDVQKNHHKERLLRLLQAKVPLTIQASFSPEGREGINTNLANERAETLVNYLKELSQNYQLQMPLLDSKVSNSTDFKADLVGFLTSSADFDNQISEEIRNIIDTSSYLSALDKAFSSKNYYSKITQILYPKLRYVKITIQTHQTTLQQVTEEETYLKSLQTLVAQNDAPWAHHNIGNIYLRRALKNPDSTQKNILLQKALYHTAIAYQIGQMPESIYQELYLYALLKQEDKVSETLKKATEQKIEHPEIAHLQAIQLFKQAKSSKDKKYKEALQYFQKAGNEGFVLFNKSLTHLILHEYDKAHENLETLKKYKPQEALIYYLQALIEARKGNEQACKQYLVKTFELNNLLKLKAKNDLEFEQFENSSDFMSIFK